MKKGFGTTVMAFDFDQFHEIFTTIRMNKLRTALTGFSVAWGIFMIVLLLGSSNGIEHGVQDDFKRFAVNSVFIYGGQTSLPYEGFKPGRVIELDNQDIETVSRMAGVERISARFHKRDNGVTFQNRFGAFDILACGPDNGTIENISITAGRRINQLDIDQARKTAVIGTQVEAILFKNRPAVGNQIMIDGIPFWLWARSPRRKIKIPTPHLPAGLHSSGLVQRQGQGPWFYLHHRRCTGSAK